MTPEKTEKLFQKYPKIFSEAGRRTIRFGLECSDGWYDLICELCDKLQAHCDEKNSSGASFQIVAIQVKEKFGGLRFYVTGGDEYSYGLIRKAENDSYKICEECGAPGKLYQRGWWLTQCEPCREKHIKMKNGQQI
jgi:hypothetical protein